MTQKRSLLVLLSFAVGAVLIAVGVMSFNSFGREGKFEAQSSDTKVAGNSASSSDQPNASETQALYVNKRSDFSFGLPVGYEVAVDCMSLMNKASAYPIAGWSAINTQDVLLLPEESAQTGYPCGTVFSSGFDPESVSGGIYVAIVGNSLADIENSLADLQSLRASPIQFVSVRYFQLSGNSAISYTALNSTNDQTEDIAYISFERNVRLSSGSPVETIFVTGNGSSSQVSSAVNEILATLNLE
jgi:hypothetical protein